MLPAVLLCSVSRLIFSLSCLENCVVWIGKSLRAVRPFSRARRAGSLGAQESWGGCSFLTVHPADKKYDSLCGSSRGVC